MRFSASNRKNRVNIGLSALRGGIAPQLAPWLSEQHPWRWGEPGELLLDGMVLEPCRRNLGLADLKLEAADDTWKARPQWS